MAKQTGSVHDLFVRHCLSDLKLAKAFFRQFLTPQQKAEIDLDQLKPGGKESFVSQELKSVTTDLLFKAPINNHPGFISLLVEHKSEGAARGKGQILPFQMRSQEMMVMEYGRKNHPKNCYPLVHLVGLYHGESEYTAPRSVGEKIDAPASMIPDRWKENIELIDLSAFSDEAQKTDPKLGVFLLVLKHVYAADMLKMLEDIAPDMQKIEQEEGDEFIMTVFGYLFKAAKLENPEPMIHIAKKTFSEGVGDKMMTLAELWEKRGEQRGEKRGEEKKSIEIAKIMLADHQPVEYIMKLTSLTIDQIKALANNQDSNLGSA